MFRGIEQFDELSISPTFDFQDSSGSLAKASITPLFSTSSIYNCENKDLPIGVCNDTMNPVEITKNVNETQKLNKV